MHKGQLKNWKDDKGFGYQRFGSSTTSTPAQHFLNTLAPSGSLLNSAFSESNSNFSCDGRQHCSQMTSRAEAEYFINHCPNTKMDGDKDGILVKMNHGFNFFKDNSSHKA